jgi:hypothetical protein
MLVTFRDLMGDFDLIHSLNRELESIFRNAIARMIGYRRAAYPTSQGSPGMTRTVRL